MLLPEEDAVGPDLDDKYVEQKTKANQQQRTRQEESRSHKTTSAVSGAETRQPDAAFFTQQNNSSPQNPKTTTTFVFDFINVSYVLERENQCSLTHLFTHSWDQKFQKTSRSVTCERSESKKKSVY